jgi:hypothetical protein
MLTAKRLMLAITFVIGGTALLSAQESGPQAISKRQVHWVKYINKEYGLSLWYPDSYKRSDFDGRCEDNEYRRYLLCLQRSDDPDSSITVTLITGAPFFMKPLGNSDALPVRRIIGHKAFYCGVQGSMGVGFYDECIFNLKNRVLEFGFEPTMTLNSGLKQNPLASKVLMTFRVL